jgi:hypothetical protein
MRIFDYAFYSLYTLYLKKEGVKSNPISSANSAVIALKLSLLLGILFFYLSFTPKDFNLLEYLGISGLKGKIIVVIIAFIWMHFSYKSYKKRLPEILKKYRNHPRNKWFRAWMLYFVALGFVLIPILIIKILKSFS